MAQLNGKIALITGATSGIGKATAQLFHMRGAQVILTGRNEKQGKAIEQHLGKNALFLPLDVSVEQDWITVCQEIENRFSRLDVLVNNAGISGHQTLEQKTDVEHLSFRAWRAVHAVNLDGIFLGCKYGLRLLKRSLSGSIINVSSRFGIVGNAHDPAYCSSKGAVRNFTKSVALYCAQQGYPIRCNSVHPGMVKTPLWDKLLPAETNNKIPRNPLKRFGSPEEVAQAIVFLASDESSYMTGSELAVDGGILAGSAA